MEYAPIPKHKLFQNLNGIRFNRLIVLGYVGRVGANNQWHCLCDCGLETIVSGGNLKSKHTISCGCFHKEQTSKSVKKHGKTNSPEYKIWSGMKTRCSDLSNEKYGGRGIFVCERWINSFENFIADMGQRPSSKHSIERINNNGNYEPTNCRWATDIEQAWNRRNTRKDIFDGKIYSLKEISELTQIPKSLIIFRFASGKRGNELLKDKHYNRQSITFNGITDTCAGWARRTGLTEDTISQRLRRDKWSVEKTLTTGV